MLRITDVVKRYGDRTALAGLSLSVEAGEVLGLLGPNGAGKSTLASIAAGLRPPDQGRVWVHDVDVVATPSLADGGQWPPRPSSSAMLLFFVMMWKFIASF